MRNDQKATCLVITLALMILVLLPHGGAVRVEEGRAEPTTETARVAATVKMPPIGEDIPAQVRGMCERLAILAARYDLRFEVGAPEKDEIPSFCHFALETYGRHLPEPEWKEGAMYDMMYIDPDQLVATWKLIFDLDEGREYDFWLSLSTGFPEGKAEVIAAVLMALEDDLSMSQALTLANEFIETWPDNACDHFLDIGEYRMLGNYNMWEQASDMSRLSFLRRADFWSDAFAAEYYTPLQPEWVENSEKYPGYLCRFTGKVEEVIFQPDIHAFLTTRVHITTEDGAHYTLCHYFPRNPYPFEVGRTYDIWGMVDLGGVIRIDRAQEAGETNESAQKP